MSSKYPSVTCYCPVFKGGRFIKGYMEDMLCQTIFKEVQFFILDCASPDNEAEIILPYTKQHPNITYKRLDKDPGLYPAWNFCIQFTNGDFLTNWNVDDRKTPWSLEVMRDFLVLNIGFSHSIYFEKPDGITFETPNANTVIIKGINKQEVGQVAANIRELRKPEPYKGKGIKYADEYIRRKVGKSIGLVEQG